MWFFFFLISLSIWEREVIICCLCFYFHKSLSLNCDQIVILIVVSLYLIKFFFLQKWVQKKWKDVFTSGIAKYFDVSQTITVKQPKQENKETNNLKENPIFCDGGLMKVLIIDRVFGNRWSTILRIGYFRGLTTLLSSISQLRLINSFNLCTLVYWN